MQHIFFLQRDFCNFIGYSLVFVLSDLSTFSHDMEHTQVVDGGDGLQIWRVAANILNKQLRTAYMGRPSSLGVGQGLTTPTIKEQLVMKCSTEPQTWMDFLA
jgi:hypothetical protein